MSLKKIAFAFVAVFSVAGAAKADDLMNDLASMDLASINDSAADVEELDLDGMDFDQMAENAGEDSDAIEACFRRFGGYRHGGWRHWGGCYNYGYRCYNRCYNYCRPYYCHRPIVTYTTHCLPVITSYWGCY